MITYEVYFNKTYKNSCNLIRKDIKGHYLHIDQVNKVVLIDNIIIAKLEEVNEVRFLVKGYYQITVGAGGAGGPRVHGKGGARGGNGGVSQLLYSANSDMSNPKVVIVCNGGGGASASSCAYHGSHPGNPGAGGQVSISSDLIVKDLFLKTNGLGGIGEAGGNSVYSGTTYGKGGNANSNPGNSGYVKVKLL